VDINDWKDRIAAFVDECGLSQDPFMRVMCSVEEMGELAKEALKSVDYGRRNFKASPDFQTELGDVLFDLLCVAAFAGVDPDAALNATMRKMAQRIKDKGHPGSRT